MSELPERLPSRPLRNWFLAWHIHTGDPADVIAKGFDLDPTLVADFLSGEVALMVPSDDAMEICRSTNLSPSLLWGTEAAWGQYTSEALEPEVEALTQALSRRER